MLFSRLFQLNLRWSQKFTNIHQPLQVFDYLKKTKLTFTAESAAVCGNCCPITNNYYHYKNMFHCSNQVNTPNDKWPPPVDIAASRKHQEEELLLQKNWWNSWSITTAPMSTSNKNLIDSPQNLTKIQNNSLKKIVQPLVWNTL